MLRKCARGGSGPPSRAIVKSVKSLSTPDAAVLVISHPSQRLGNHELPTINLSPGTRSDRVTREKGGRGSVEDQTSECGCHQYVQSKGTSFYSSYVNHSVF
jgi:hypothetical protein